MSQIDEAIRELTHVTGEHSGPMVWVYGQVLWAKHPAFEFVAIRGREYRQVEIIADAVECYREGDTDHFLIKMSATMAQILGIERLVLSVEETEKLKRKCFMERPW